MATISEDDMADGRSAPDHAGHHGSGSTADTTRDLRNRLLVAAGVFAPWFGLVLRPELAAPSMSGSSLLVALNALRLRRLRLPRSVPAVEEAAADVSGAR
ncbi:MAG: hypothetical protein GXX79_16545 [Actinomycetales bacterium]|nr:hypothetical protein [Actinomycetales bacterium]